jgi:DNA-binding phage protein
MKMALTRDFRETVQARVKRDPAFRKGLLSDAMESLLSGDIAAGKELLRDYINATVGFPKLAEETSLHVKALHQMFGPNGNPTATNLFHIVAYLQKAEGIRLEVKSQRAASRAKRWRFTRASKRISARTIGSRSR